MDNVKIVHENFVADSKEVHKSLIRAFDTKSKQEIGQLEYYIYMTPEQIFDGSEIDMFLDAGIDIYEVLTKKFIYLSYVIVNPDYVKMGYANMLMSEFVKILKTKMRSFETVILQAVPFANNGKKDVYNIPYEVLSAFYKKYGFETLLEIEGLDTQFMILKNQ